MFAFNDILQKIEQEITRLQFTYPPKSLYDPIEYILSLGGKRIRPALVLMACNLYKENVDFFCDCNLASVDVYAGHLATEIQKGLYVSSFPATDFENVGICRNRFMLFNERYYIFLCRNTLFVEI